MIRRLSIALSLALGISLVAHSQRVPTLEAYPVREGHKWGYILIDTLYGIDTIIRPYYDFIGDVPLPWHKPDNMADLSPYRLYEVGGKVGLLKGSLKPNSAILNGRYDLVFPLTARYFAVRFHKDSLFRVINDREEVVVGPRATTISMRWNPVASEKSIILW
ncbi:MAG: hypothetical protein IPJ82_22050 [Lewinellaceae bacterium]|nr:hypothetical protein [Lewinellaceae bacterium]